MPEIKQGRFSINIGFIQFGVDLTEDDRQCAWELYTEISTRLAVVGKLNDDNCVDFSGEVLFESLQSLYSFFQSARNIMKKYPVGSLKGKKAHLGVLINSLMEGVLRPFLEKWQSEFRHWWQYESNQSQPPFIRQENYNNLTELKDDWSNLRLIMRKLRSELLLKFDLVNTTP